MVKIRRAFLLTCWALSVEINALPSDIRAVGDMKAFRQAVKTHYFSLAFSVYQWFYFICILFTRLLICTYVQPVIGALQMYDMIWYMIYIKFPVINAMHPVIFTLSKQTPGVSHWADSPFLHSDGEADAGRVQSMNHLPFTHSIDFRSVHATSGRADRTGQGATDKET